MTSWTSLPGHLGMARRSLGGPPGGGPQLVPYRLLVTAGLLSSTKGNSNAMRLQSFLAQLASQAGETWARQLCCGLVARRVAVVVGGWWWLVVGWWLVVAGSSLRSYGPLYWIRLQGGSSREASKLSSLLDLWVSGPAMACSYGAELVWARRAQTSQT